MAFYRNKITYGDLAPRIQKFKTFLSQCGKLMNNPDEDGYEVFFFEAAYNTEIRTRFEKEAAALRMGGYINIVPFFNDPTPGSLIYFVETEDMPRPTVSPTHIRLPKLSHLITLAPHDFFSLFKIIATAKNSASGDALSLNLPAAGITNLQQSIIGEFFTVLKVNYRLNPDYCDRKWTLREVTNSIAKLDPTRENQLSAMQYLTALQNPDLLYFPIDAVLDLELDWEQADDSYCVPPIQTT